MGLFQHILDWLKDLPLSALLKERLALAEDKYERAAAEDRELAAEIKKVKDQIAALKAEQAEALQTQKVDPELIEDTVRVLLYLFNTAVPNDRDAGRMSTALKMEPNVLQYHLDRLKAAGFAYGGGSLTVHGHSYWNLTPRGRQHVVEEGLI